MGHRILIVDDHPLLVRVLSLSLERAGYSTISAHDTPTALHALASQSPTLMILDINLGAYDGFDLLRAVRQQSQVPVIMLTARDDAEDKVKALELGADDYVVKPFSQSELVARVGAHLRRQNYGEGLGPGQSLQFGRLQLDGVDFAVSYGSQPHKVSASEFRLLYLLAERRGAVVPVRTILRRVWGYGNTRGIEVVSATLDRLVHEVADMSSGEMAIDIVPGVGARLRVGAEAAS